MERQERYPDYSPEYRQVNNALRQTRRQRPSFRGAHFDIDTAQNSIFYTELSRVVQEITHLSDLNSLQSDEMIFNLTLGIDMLKKIVCQFKLNPDNQLDLYDVKEISQDQFKKCCKQILEIIHKKISDDEKIAEIANLLQSTD